MITNTDLLDDVIDNLLQITRVLIHEHNYSQAIRDLLFDTQLTMRQAEHPSWREVLNAYHELNTHNPYTD